MKKYSITIKQKLPDEPMRVITDEVFADSSAHAHRKAVDFVDKDSGKLVIITKLIEE